MWRNFINNINLKLTPGPTFSNAFIRVLINYLYNASLRKA